MSDWETNNGPDSSGRKPLWNVEKNGQLNALRRSIRNSTGDLIKYLELRAERAAIEWHFSRLEQAFMERMFQAVSERLPSSDPKTLTAQSFKERAEFEATITQRVSDHRQSLLAAARRYIDTPPAQRQIAVAVFCGRLPRRIASCWELRKT